MAFLSNTERNCDFLHCTNPNLLSTEASLYKHESGPDTYDKTFNDISTRIRSTFHTHIPSFNHTAERLMSKNPLKHLQQQTPGPGSYLPIQTTNFINVAKIDETNPQHFLSRTERFKYLSGSNNTETTPGPGEYNSNDAKRFDKYKNNNKIISKLHYYIDKGITSKDKDKENDEAIGDGSDIGPGEYNVYPRWKKNVVDWGKMSYRKERTSTEKANDSGNGNGVNSNSSNNGNCNDMEINTVFKMKDIVNKHNIRKVNTKHDVFKQVLSQRREMYMSSLYKSKHGNDNSNDNEMENQVAKEIAKKEKQLQEKLHKRKHKQTTTTKYKVSPNKLYQYFGSCASRFNTNYSLTEASQQQTPGPGTYEPQIKRSLIYDINISPKLHNRKVKHKILPGINGLVITSNGNKCVLSSSNSETNVTHSHSNNTRVSLPSNFGSSERRFKDKVNEHNSSFNTPGPGSYELNMTNISTQLDKNKHCNNIIKPNHKERYHINKHNNKNTYGFYNEPLPTFGEGKTMQGDLEKYASLTEKKIPFGCKVQRFKNDIDVHIKQTTHLGPGCYYSQDNSNNHNQHCKYSLNIPFNSQMPRITITNNNAVLSKDEQCMVNEIGPGLYKLDSYYDWNKKSYNVRYV